MSKATWMRLAEHCAAVALVAIVSVVIGWCLAESHRGVLEATGRSPGAGRLAADGGAAGVLAVMPAGGPAEIPSARQ